MNSDPIVQKEIASPNGVAPLSYGPEVIWGLTSSEEQSERDRKRKAAAETRRRRADQVDFDLFQQVALERSELAFSELYDRYSPRVYAMMLHYFRVEEDALDYLQDTMILLWEKAPQLYRENTNVRAAIYHFSRNCAVNALRSRKRTKVIQSISQLADDQPRLEELLADDSTPETALNMKESRQQVREALMTLSPAQRSAIDLAYFGGMTHDEIAEHMGLGREGVKSLVARGIQRLAAILRPQFQAPEEPVVPPKKVLKTSPKNLKKDWISIIPYDNE